MPVCNTITLIWADWSLSLLSLLCRYLVKVLKIKGPPWKGQPLGFMLLMRINLWNDIIQIIKSFFKKTALFYVDCLLIALFFPFFSFAFLCDLPSSPLFPNNHIITTRMI